MDATPLRRACESVPSPVGDGSIGTATTRPLPQAVLTYGDTHLQTAIRVAQMTAEGMRVSECVKE